MPRLKRLNTPLQRPPHQNADVVLSTFYMPVPEPNGLTSSQAILFININFICCSIGVRLGFPRSTTSLEKPEESFCTIRNYVNLQ